jgi:hypothetical protein
MLDEVPLADLDVGELRLCLVDYAEDQTRGEVLFTMAGPWDLTIRIVTPSGRLEIPLREEVARRR